MKYFNRNIDGSGFSLVSNKDHRIMFNTDVEEVSFAPRNEEGWQTIAADGYEFDRDFAEKMEKFIDAHFDEMREIDTDSYYEWELEGEQA
jgi:hypothetical protein